MLEHGQINGEVFDPVAAPWVPFAWLQRFKRVPAPEACRIWGRPWPVGGDCCIWTAGNDGKKSGPHGKTRWNGQVAYVHRIELSLHLGVDIATLEDGDHICRNSLCWNPYHLESVSRKENTDRGDGVNTQFKKLDNSNAPPGNELSDEDIAALLGQQKYG